MVEIKTSTEQWTERNVETMHTQDMAPFQLIANFWLSRSRCLLQNFSFCIYRSNTSTSSVFKSPQPATTSMSHIQSALSKELKVPSGGNLHSICVTSRRRSNSFAPNSKLTFNRCTHSRPGACGKHTKNCYIYAQGNCCCSLQM